MRSEIAKLKKTDILWLADNKCKHGHSFIEHYSCYEKRAHIKKLFIDIETSPSLGWVYGKYEQTVLKFKKEWHIMCIGYKWDDGKFQILIGNERQIIRKIRDLFDEADIIIGHNEKRFDIKKINTRIAFYGFNPPSKYKTIDTLLKVRSIFGLNSNKLGDVGEYFGLGTKNGSYADLWEDYLKGSKKAERRLIKYNRQDVLLLEKIYLKIEPWL